MKPRRAARRLLDPWAGLLLGALIVLAVVILLATPGPWRTVVGSEAPMTLTAESPSDVCVFVLAGPPEARCTAVVWLHLEHEPAAAVAVLVPPATRCAVPGGGYAPIRRLVTDLDPEAAAGALGDALGVPFDGWVTLDREALGSVLEAAHTAGDARQGARDFAGSAALVSPPLTLADLRRQHLALARSLSALRLGLLHVNAFANYLLGSENVATDMDLRAVSAVARTLRSLGERGIAVRTAAAIVETCGLTRSWRLDESRLEPLRLSLALGVTPSPARPRIRLREVAAEVDVAVPPGVDGERLADTLRTALIRDAGARAVNVRAVVVRGEATGERLGALVARRRPLAFVIVPWVAAAGPWAAPGVPQQEGGSSSDWSAQDLEEAAKALDVARQPAVLVAPPPDAPDESVTAAEKTDLPLVDVSPSGDAVAAGGVASVDGAGRLLAAAVARACWPDYLAPTLAGTRLGFSYAARRGTEVAVIGAQGADLSAWLAACGYAVVDAGSGWQGPDGTGIVHRSGARRAAYSLAGDIGWPASSVTRDATAPATLTVVTPGE